MYLAEISCLDNLSQVNPAADGNAKCFFNAFTVHNPSSQNKFMMAWKPIYFGKMNFLL